MNATLAGLALGGGLAVAGMTGGSGLIISEHAAQQAAARGVTRTAIQQAFNQGIRQASPTDVTAKVYLLSSVISKTGRSVKIVVNHLTNTVITVIDKGKNYLTK